MDSHAAPELAMPKHYQLTFYKLGPW